MKIPESMRKNRYNDSKFKIYRGSNNALRVVPYVKGV